MTVLVDTTVWIDFFADRQTPQVAKLQELIENDDDLCLCGVILAEILQGIRSDADYRRTKSHLDSLLFFSMHRSTFLDAAALYRSLRKKGITIRKSVDCMIASVALQHDLALLHNDRVFDQIAKHSRLKVLKTGKPTKG